MLMGFDLTKLFQLTKAEIGLAGRVVARAFQDDPLMIYFFPDPSNRKMKLPYIFEYLIRYGIKYGEVYAPSPKLEGIAVWLPSEKSFMTMWRGFLSGGLSLILQIGMSMFLKHASIYDYVISMHKRLAPSPHAYLSVLGVNPEQQGKGHASKLLNAMFNRIDQEQLPCYLETNNEKNVPIYQNFGFKVLEEAQLPGTEVLNWAMLRESLSKKK